MKVSDVKVPQGVDPEDLAYAFAMVSRSPDNFETRLAKVRDKSPEQVQEFYEKFYFDYGHASIADSAMVPMSIEAVSQQAAMELVDQPLWFGQQQSTRYQNVLETGWYSQGFDRVYDAKVSDSLQQYSQLTTRLVEAWMAVKEMFPGHDTLSPAKFRKTLEARALDITRNILPMGNLTQVVQVVPARILDEQIRRINTLGHYLDDKELRQLAIVMKLRAHEAVPNLIGRISDADQDIQALLGVQKLGRLADTIISESDYKDVAGLNETLLHKFALVDVYLNTTNIGEELLATLLLKFKGINWNTGLQIARDMSSSRKAWLVHEIMEVIDEHRLQWLRLGELGQRFVVQIYADTGAVRDLLRHRRNTIIRPLVQPTKEMFPAGNALALGWPLSVPVIPYDVTEALTEATKWREYDGPIDLRERLQPMARMSLVLMKMDYAQLRYILKLRSRPGGHPHYRHMMQRAASAANWIVPSGFEVTVSPIAPTDFLNR